MMTGGGKKVSYLLKPNKYDIVFRSIFVGIMAHYWNGGYTVRIVVILLKRWPTIGMVAILLK